MTCIIGYVDGSSVYIGGDGQGSSYNYKHDDHCKVFKNTHNPEFLFGHTNDFRFGRLLRYCFVPPENRYDWDIDRYMVDAVSVTMRECLKTHEYAHISSGVS